VNASRASSESDSTTSSTSAAAVSSRSRQTSASSNRNSERSSSDSNTTASSQSVPVRNQAQQTLENQKNSGQIAVAQYQSNQSLLESTTQASSRRVSEQA
jgi:hypothetical protein